MDEELAKAVRDAGNDIAEALINSIPTYPEDSSEQKEMIPRAICSAAEIVAGALPFVGAGDDDGGDHAIFDGLYAVSVSLEHVARAIQAHTQMLRER